MEVLYGCAPFWERLFMQYLVPTERMTASLAWPLLRCRAPTCGARPRRLEKRRLGDGTSYVTAHEMAGYGAAHGTPAFLPWLWTALAAVAPRELGFIRIVIAPWNTWTVSQMVGERGDVAVVTALHAIRPGLSCSFEPMMLSAAKHDRATLLDWCLATHTGDGDAARHRMLVRDCVRAACIHDAACVMHALLQYGRNDGKCAMHIEGLRLALMHGAVGVANCLVDDKDMRARAVASIDTWHPAFVITMLHWSNQLPTSVAWLEAHYDVLACAIAVIVSPDPVYEWLMAVAIAYRFRHI